ncbi:MAG TPA: hypothetical protein PLS87_11410 [Ferruginibacter sp.]|nr:hypothetical protein [Ferruginibacter sp.]
MEDLFLHDQDKGLFKTILSKSSIIQGRFSLSPDYGFNLNTDNLNTFFKDEKFGVSNPNQKYPMCVCITPRSFIEQEQAGAPHTERFIYDLFFLTKDNQTGQNQIKSLDKSTGLSAHHVWYDWSDMKRVSDSFISALNKVLRKLPPTTPFRLLFDTKFIPVKRITRVNNDVVNGIGITLTIISNHNIMCDTPDYGDDDLSDLSISGITSDIHPKHKM